MLPHLRGDAATQPQLCVLIVDDDKLIRLALGDLLSPFMVTFAQSAAGALGRLQAGGSFDAIVCDIYMPGMNGMQFYEEVARISNQLANRIIFISGGASSPEVADFLGHTPNTFLFKPVNREALKSAVLAAAGGSQVAASLVEGGY